MPRRLYPYFLTHVFLETVRLWTIRIARLRLLPYHTEAKLQRALRQLTHLARLMNWQRFARTAWGIPPQEAVRPQTIRKPKRVRILMDEMTELTDEELKVRLIVY